MNLRYSDETHASQILVGKGIRDSSKNIISELEYVSKLSDVSEKSIFSTEKYCLKEKNIHIFLVGKEKMKFFECFHRHEPCTLPF